MTGTGVDYRRSGPGPALRRLLAAGLVALGLLGDPGAASAQVHFFLSRTGQVLSLHQASPRSPTSTFATSAPVTDRAGNPWTDVGTWSAEFRPAPFVDVMSAGDLRVWVAPEKRDESRTAFDLRAEVWVKGVGTNPVLVAHGMSRCIAPAPGDPNTPKPVVIPFTSIDTIFSNGTETLSLKVLTRMGTTPEDRRCSGPGAGQADAMGLRVYFGSATYPSRFDLLIAIP
jgi:hypothetical protein